jgi:RNA polymerase sigma factor (TIGR02999 family)
LDWNRGDQTALDQLLPLVYDELRRLAEAYMRREFKSHTLQPTALVHEAYLRLVDQQDVQWQNRAQFLGVAAQMMRRILVDHARRRRAAKRDSGGIKVTLDKAVSVSDERDLDLVALDDALMGLAAIDAQKERIVELRFFGGLNVEETAEVLKVSPRTIDRQWRLARAFLYNELKN